MAKLNLKIASGSELKNRELPVRVLGIDLGTTNSTVAEMSVTSVDGKPVARLRCIPVPQETEDGLIESPVLPSAVAVHEGRTWVGEGARQLRAKAGALGLVAEKDYFFEVKNDMGLKRTYADAPEGLRNATEVSAQVQRTRYQAALAANPAVTTLWICVALFETGI